MTDTTNHSNSDVDVLPWKEIEDKDLGAKYGEYAQEVAVAVTREEVEMIVRSHLDALLNLVFTFEVYQTTGSSLLYRRAYHNERISHFIDTGAISDKRFEELRVHQ